MFVKEYLEIPLHRGRQAELSTDHSGGIFHHWPASLAEAIEKMEYLQISESHYMICVVELTVFMHQDKEA